MFQITINNQDHQIILIKTIKKINLFKALEQEENATMIYLE
jgi:hypothetical protein